MTVEPDLPVLSFELLEVGRSVIPGPELFWMSHFGQSFPLHFQVGLIRTASATILVNSGPEDDLQVMNEGWKKNLGPGSEMSASGEMEIVSQLRRRGIAPGDVTHVICTPLQLYSTGGILKFPNAQICLSRRGWVQLLTTKSHPHDTKEYSMSDGALRHLVTEGWEKLRLLEDEDLIVDGVRVWWTGAHHRASIAVSFNYGGIRILLCDAIFYLENLTTRHPIGVCESIEEALAFFDRAADYGAVFPLYDPGNQDRLAEIERRLPS